MLLNIEARIGELTISETRMGREKLPIGAEYLRRDRPHHVPCQVPPGRETIFNFFPCAYPAYYDNHCGVWQRGRE